MKAWKLVAVFLVAVGLVVGLLQGLGVVQVGGLMDWLTFLTFSAIAFGYIFFLIGMIVLVALWVLYLRRNKQAML